MAQKIFAQNPEKFIPALAELLKQLPEFEAPEWATFVKSGSSRERPPALEDFWYTRAASILRQLYIKGVLGVGKLRTKYGSRKDRGGKPDKFRKASGKIIRVILQQAENAGLVEKLDRLQFGRRLTAKGRDLLDSIEVEEKVSFDIANATVEIKPVQQEVEENEEDGDESEVEESSKDDSGKPSGEPETETKENVEEEIKDGK